MSRNFRMVKPRFWAMLFVALIITCIAVYASQQQYINRQQETIADLEADLQRAAEVNADLQRKIDFTYTDEYIEREARSKLGLVKEGEILYESND